ncbi:glutaredoxin-related protein [Flavobacterium sp. 2755]|nr:glutaredoxin-related protein [Flavobacterium sp. 2755]
MSTDGFAEEMRVTSYVELQSKIMEVLQNYNAEKHLVEMKKLSEYSLTEHQFATLLGRSKLYQHMPKSHKINIPALNFNDGQLNVVAKDYYEDEHFGRNSDGDLNLWNMYSLFTQANKSSYIDTFLDRNVNAFDFSNGISNALIGSANYRWFLS